MATARSPHLNARQAAAYVGYEPTPGVPTAKDPAMRAFYMFIRRRRVTTERDGRRLLFRTDDLDRAIAASTAAQQTSAQQMADLGRRMARGEPRSSVM